MIIVLICLPHTHPQCLPQLSRVMQGLDNVQSLLDARNVKQRLLHPLLQQSRALWNPKRKKENKRIKKKREPISPPEGE